MHEKQFEKTKAAEKPTFILFIIYALIGLGSIYFGNLFHSVTLKSSGIDSLVGSLTEGMLLVGLIMSRDPETVDDGYYFGYGHWRDTTVMNAACAVLIIYGGYKVVTDGIQNFMHFLQGDVALPNYSAIYVSIGVIFILLIAMVYFSRLSKKLDLASLKTSIMDMRSDILTSSMVIISVLGARLCHLYWLDGVIGIIIGLLIIRDSIKLLITSVLHLVDAIPKKQLDAYVNEIQHINGVNAVDHINIHWIGDELILDVHVLVDGQLTINQADTLKAKINHDMQKHAEIKSLNIMMTAK